MNWHLYLLEFTLISTVVYLCYQLLKTTTPSAFLRCWLAGGMLLALTFPFLSIQVYSEEFAVFLPEMDISEILSSRDTQSEEQSLSIGWGIYIVGAISMTIFILWQARKILQLFRESKSTLINGMNVRQHEQIDTPFSFFHYIFLPQHHSYRPKEIQIILEHEKAHVQWGHTIDLFFLLILRCLLWFHPMIYLFERELRIVHEFQADESVVKKHKHQDYFQTLLRETFGHLPILSQSAFGKGMSLRIKNLRTMKHKSIFTNRTASACLGLLVVLFITSILHSASGPQNSLSSTMATWETSTTQSDTDKVYKVVDEMPRFPGCEDQPDLQAKNKCAQSALINYITENIRYPEEAKADGVEGVVVVRFVIDENGVVRNEETVRDPGKGTGKEGLRIIEKMREDGIRWVPGKADGQNVKVQFNLPIRFQLPKKEKDEE